MRYEDFLAGKQHIPPSCGFEVDKPAMNIHMFEWQKDIRRWALRKGRAALFVERITGDYNNVVGLPAARLARTLCGEWPQRTANTEKSGE